MNTRIAASNFNNRPPVFGKLAGFSVVVWASVVVGSSVVVGASVVVTSSMFVVLS